MLLARGENSLFTSNLLCKLYLHPYLSFLYGLRKGTAHLQIFLLFFSFLYLLIDLGLEGDHQLLNASLALQLCQTWFLRRCEKDNTPEGLIFISLNIFNL